MVEISRRRILQGIAAASFMSGSFGKKLIAAVTARYGARALTNTSRSPNAVLRGIDMDAVRWKSGFWADRFEVVRTSMIPTMWDVVNMPDNGCTFVTFRVVAGAPPQKTYVTPYSDGDFYKWLEGVAHVYAVTRDPALDKRMDDAIAIIVKAQTPDGYISTPVQVRDGKRWEHIRNHELYNMGHLMTAAVVHNRATGKETLLGVAKRAADYLYVTFSPRPPELAHFAFNPSQIMGLVELYRSTGERTYLELAGIFISNRGSSPGGSDMNQDRTPLRKANEAVGHAVLAAYLYAGATDYIAETNDADLRAAMNRLWDDVETRKVYVTGAIGALHSGVSGGPGSDEIEEAFGLDYQLPNRTAYNETCANIANAMWNWRMLSLTGDAKYADMMERVFYNSMLSGVSLSGKEYFYTNVLRRDTTLPMLSQDTLERWPNTAVRREPGRKTSPAFCCPPNVLRTLASMHEYMYSLSKDTVWVHFYAANELDTMTAEGLPVHLMQETEYPWDGKVTLTVGPKASGKFSIRMRIPEWSAGAGLTVNGKAVQAKLTPGTYEEIRRAWKSGDTIVLDLPMPARLVMGSPKVDDTRGQVAVMRGPMVYCIESTDLPTGLTIDDLAITPQSILSAKHESALLGGVTVLKVKARQVPKRNATGPMYQTLTLLPHGEVELQMIPYYAWANRGVSSMTVWLPLLS